MALRAGAVAVGQGMETAEEEAEQADLSGFSPLKLPSHLYDRGRSAAP